MKKLLILILFLFALVGCKTNQPGTMTMEVDLSAITEGMKVSEFELSDIILHVTYPDGSKVNVPVTSNMLFQSDLNKLATAGEHTITIQYKTLEKVVVITLEEDVVEPINPTAITITGPTTVKVGQMITLNATIAPTTAPQTLVWESTNTEIATVSEGVVTGVSTGNVTIRVTSFVLSSIHEEVVISVIPSTITDDYETYYDSAEGLEGEALKTALHNIIDDHQTYSYDFAKTALRNTDEDPNNSNNVILMYTGRSQAKTAFGSNGDDWNREHTWPKSHGSFGEVAPMGTDLHHLRPTDASVNSTRGNKDFDNGGSQVNDTYGSGSSYCYTDSDSFEPRDEVKGDVARIIFYMATRYEGDKSGEVDLELVDRVDTSGPALGKLSTLLAWNEEDPVDDFERNRNNVIFDYQGNRNPFVDHPEFADMIWGNQSLESNFDVKVYQISSMYVEKRNYIFI